MLRQNREREARCTYLSSIGPVATPAKASRSLRVSSARVGWPKGGPCRGLEGPDPRGAEASTTLSRAIRSAQDEESPAPALSGGGRFLRRWLPAVFLPEHLPKEESEVEDPAIQLRFAGGLPVNGAGSLGAVVLLHGRGLLRQCTFSLRGLVAGALCVPDHLPGGIATVRAEPQPARLVGMMMMVIGVRGSSLRVESTCPIPSLNPHRLRRGEENRRGLPKPPGRRRGADRRTDGPQGSGESRLDTNAAQRCSGYPG